jgi:fatty acid kinase fatty acid binding subunit
MARVAVVTDSTANLPPNLIERHDIQVVPLYVIFGGDRTVPETEITDYPAFFEELRGSESLPRTSQPSIGDFTSVYEPLLVDGGEVVSLHISGGLSGTPDAARQAAQALERDGKGGDRVRVIDSNTVAGGLAMVVLAAAKAAREERGLDEVEAHALSARADMKIWFALDTLEFLRRGGRIGPASAWIGSTLKVKPILSLEREMVPVERVRTSARMLDRLLDYARQRHESGADAWAVQHINAPDQCERLVAGCREIFGTDALLVSEVGPVLSAHAGPGMLGVGSLPREYVE